MKVVMHKCPTACCREEVNDGLLMCRRHWYMVPASLRAVITKLWRTQRDGSLYRAAVKQAIRVVDNRTGQLELALTA